MFDCHVHSIFSTDSIMTAHTACKRALELGLKGLAFTDHLDYDYPNFDEGFMIDFDKYSDFMDKLKAEYQDKLKILMGIEVGIQPHVLQETLDVVNKYSFDMVIASTHIIGGVDPYYGDYYIGKTKAQSFTQYLEEILFAVENFSNYDVVGHIGYIRRYGNLDDRSMRYLDFHDLLDMILKKIISDGKGIEINSSGYRSGLQNPIPDYDIVERYIELGGEIVSVGSDGHCPEHIGFGFNIVKEKLLNLGLKHVVHFENRKPIFDML